MKLAPWAIAGGLAVILGLSGTAYMVRADDNGHHSGNMHGEGWGNMAGMMSGVDMSGTEMDFGAMDEMHATMTDLHGAMGGPEVHGAMHAMMAR